MGEKRAVVLSGNIFGGAGLSLSGAPRRAPMTTADVQRVDRWGAQ